MDAVPILAGGDGHIADGEILIQLVKGGRAATPAGADHTGPHLHGLVEGGAVKQAVQNGNEGGIGGGIVHGTGHHQAVRRLKFGGQDIDGIVENAAAQLPAATTGNAAANGLLTHLNGFGLDAQVGEGTLQLPKGQGGVALGPGAAVDHQDFHGNLLSNLFLLFIPGRQRFAGEHRK